MKHRGKAAMAGLKMIGLSLAGFCLVAAAVYGLLRKSPLLGGVEGAMFGLWCFFGAFVMNFFRDPDPNVPADPKAVVSPAHGTVDVIDEMDEPVFMGGRCKRVSIFLSVVDVHVQQAPVAGRVALVKHTAGQFINAMKTDSAAHNENVYVGIESSGAKGERVGLRLIAGLIARRIIPWVAVGDDTGKGDRISLIQFGSRVDLYLPPTMKVTASLGQKVRGGETVLALRD